ncbi:MAG TPA: EAL domain-containing protein [Capsulimonadaceae bacterium]|jgi:diguanylate cyclase (GGDEF)-like protein/PAS domain S-box-containing protein
MSIVGTYGTNHRLELVLVITNLRSSFAIANRSVLVAALVGAALSTVLTMALQDVADSYRRAQSTLLRVRAMAYELRSLDKEAEAETGFDYVIAERSSSLDREMRADMAQLDGPKFNRVNLTAVKREYATYYSLLTGKYDCLKANDHNRAQSLGMVYVDPSFELFVNSLAGASRDFGQVSTVAGVACEVGIVGALFVSSVFMFGLFRRSEQARLGILEAEQQAVKRSEERFRSIFSNASDVAMIVKTDSVVDYVSPACQAHWGYSDEELYGTSLLGLVHPDDVNRARLVVQQSLLTPRENISSELRLRYADGSYCDHEIVINNLTSDIGVRGIVATFRNIAERKAYEDRLSHQAFHDSLTNLPNRALFLDRLQRCMMRGQPCAVMFLDLDNFKVINDSLGHDAGDRLLIAVSERLRACARRSDTVARLGGDEFTMLIEQIGEEDPAAIAQRVAESLRVPTKINEREVITTASIGIALNSSPVVDADEMLRYADTAMYHAKASGKAQYAIFHTGMNTKVMERLDLETDLRRAIELDEFELHYQPIVRLQSGKIYEVEALVRWRHPVRGLIAPGKFIPVAEETGQIVEIGRWVLREACRQVRLWQTRQEAPIALSVNLSARQLKDQHLISDVRSALDDSGLAASDLKLEITESLMMSETGADLDKLYELKSLGVSLAIDDFGTGYSSMSYLSSLPIDTIKIDRAFVSRLGGNPDDDAIVQAIIGLAKTLNLDVTSEGVETLTQHRALTALGCDRGQGFYYARPLEACDLEILLEARKIVGNRVVDAIDDRFFESLAA